MIEIKVPDLAESISEGTILRWEVKEGDRVKEGDLLLELETDKVNAEITSDENGIIRTICKAAGETARIGEVIAYIQKQDTQNAVTEPPKKPEQTIKPSPNEEGKNAIERPEEILPPSQRKKAREGKDTKKRVIDEQKPSEPAAIEAPVPQKPVERIKMSRRRKTIAANLIEAKQSTAMLTTFNEIDMSFVMDIRKRRKATFQETYQTNLGLMSFFTKAVVAALKAYPMINAEIDGEDILFKNYFDIGIAVATDGGLVVPVVRDADRLHFAEIEREIALLAEKARSNKLTLADLRGGTFTITNGGIFGSLLSTPILNTPQVGILGMHTIQTRPITINKDQLAHRPVMYVALSYDHQIVDGKEAVGFLLKIKTLLEDPELLLFE